MEAILKKDKVTTTRLFDDKNLSVGDVVDFIDSGSGDKFSEAKITRIKEITFSEMVKGAANVEGMYEHYKDYYKRDISPEDKVKQIDFEIVKNNRQVNQ